MPPVTDSPPSSFIQLATDLPSLGRGRADGDPLTAGIVQSTTFCRAGVGSDPAHQYSRVSNPTVSTLERALGDLEQAPPAVCFGSGLAAVAGLLLALLESGDHVVCGRSVYGGTVRLLNQVLPGLGVRSTFVDTTDPAAVARALRPETRLVFVETPSNPTLEVSDLRSIASLSQDAGALLAVDNTFQTAVLQQPLALGADLSVYSTTKFVEGHSLALGGAVVSRHETVLERLRFLRKCTGAIQSPFNAWVTLNGLKTLPIRLERQSRNAAEIARWLDAHPAVRLVHYPGLATEGVRRLAESQHGHGTDGEAPLHGAVLSFELEGGLEAARVVAESLRLAALVEHVGSVNTLVTHPATMTHADVPADHRRACGIADGLLRLSVGIEPAAAIRADLHQALEAVGAGAASSDPNPGEVLACPRP